MSDEARPPLRRIALGDVDRELDVTRTVLERLPDERLDWRPHEKSFSLGQLGAHVTNLLFWMKASIEEDGYDVASSPTSHEAPDSTAELLERFDALRTEVEESLESVTDEELGEPWTLSHGDEVVFTLPRLATIRSFGLSHLIHHRAQLGVYLRLLDVPVPAVYGPSADET